MKRIICMMLSVLLIISATGLFAYAGKVPHTEENESYEWAYIETKLATLQDYINKNGAVNEDGNMQLKEINYYNEKSTFSTFIVSEPDGLHFYQAYYYNSDSYVSNEWLEMSYTAGSKYVSLYIEQDTNRDYCDASARVDATTLKSYSNSISFTLSNNTTSRSYSELQKDMNQFFDLALSHWRVLLGKTIGFELSEIGLSQDCTNHKNTISWTRKESTCTEGGEEEQICKRCGKIIKTTSTPPLANHHYVNIKTPATTTSNGKVVSSCSVCGDVKKTTIIHKIASVKLNKTSFVYNGTTQKPTVTVKDAKGKVINSKYYSVNYPRGCAEIGSYKVEVVFKDLYSGKARCSFKIVPGKATDLKAVSKKAGIAKLTWSEIDGAQKYVIYYTKNKASGFKKLASTSKMSYNVKNLVSGTTYYFYIKAYVKAGGTNLYGAKSKVVSTKIK